MNLSATLKEAEAVLLARFGEVTPGMLSRDFEAKAARPPQAALTRRNIATITR
nr:hypothetical protein [Burkholderia sp. RF4-BP95]